MALFRYLDSLDSTAQPKIGVELLGQKFDLELLLAEHHNITSRDVLIQSAKMGDTRRFLECGVAPAFLGEGSDSSRLLESSIRILAPITNPEKIICVGLNYRDHAIETGKQPPTEPVIFSKLPSAIIGHGDSIQLSSLSNQVDYEAEFVVVIGKTCRRVTEEQALDHVFGYCCGHDVSSRDWQYHHSGGQWLLGKSFDTFAPLGPTIVHKDQVSNIENLRIQMRINGDIMQDSSTSELIFSVPYLISYLSQLFTFKPGDLIFTGTPAGVGVARNPQRFLKPGDVCEVEIESLGTLRNSVV